MCNVQSRGVLRGGVEISQIRPTGWIRFEFVPWFDGIKLKLCVCDLACICDWSW